MNLLTGGCPVLQLLEADRAGQPHHPMNMHFQKMKFHFFRAGQLAMLVWLISSFTGAIQAQVAGGRLKENGQKNLISFQNKQ